MPRTEEQIAEWINLGGNLQAALQTMCDTGRPVDLAFLRPLWVELEELRAYKADRERGLGELLNAVLEQAVADDEAGYEELYQALFRDVCAALGVDDTAIVSSEEIRALGDKARIADSREEVYRGFLMEVRISLGLAPEYGFDLRLIQELHSKTRIADLITALPYGSSISRSRGGQFSFNQALTDSANRVKRSMDLLEVLEYAVNGQGEEWKSADGT